MTEINLQDMLNRLDALESQDAVRRLMADYMQACDDHRGRGVADLFWDDGVWQGMSHPVEIAEGRDAIADMFEAAPKRLDFTVHYLTNEAIEVAGDTAVGRWKLLEPCVLEGTHAIWMAGRYQNDFERRNGIWRFKRIRLWIDFFTPYEQGWLKQRFARIEPIG
ncbi:MAG: nuclear transport factor 2 family protein [Zavarzinia sp.]|nr:nuclear transport factor 2 family protein [Zavarzinia sp.]